MKIVFMGTPDSSADVLEALVKSGHDVVAAYSQPPRAGGRRGKALTPSPVQARAEALGIAVFTPKTLRDARAQVEFATLGADIGVVFAYGLILPQAVLDAPVHGCLNIHASLLPRWRGAAPIQRAILAGDEEAGVGIMQMKAGLDTGPVRLQQSVPIGSHDTTGTLLSRLSNLGAQLMVRVLTDLDSYPPKPQSDDGITYATKIDKAEAQIDWTKGAQQVGRQIRAFNPSPGAWFEYRGERIKVLEARIQSAHDDLQNVTTPTRPGLVLDDQLGIGCGAGAIRPLYVQRAGRGVVTSWDLLRGFPIPAGTQLA